MSITHPERSREPFESNVRRQFNERAQTLHALGLGEGLDIEHFLNWLYGNEEFKKVKAPQGFDQLIVVPRHASPAQLVKLLGETAESLRKAGKLRDSKGRRITNPPSNVFDGAKVWVDGAGWDDNTPEAETPSHRYFFMEDFSSKLLAEGEQKTLGGRQQLETGHSSLEYLDTLKNDPSHRGETGFTQTDTLMYYLTHMMEKGKVPDDDQVTYSIAQRTEEDRIPVSFWGGTRFYLSSYPLDHHSENDGARVAVKGT